MWDGYVSLCYELTLADVMSLLELSQIHKHIRLLAIFKSPLIFTTAVDMGPFAVLLLLLVITTPPPRWRKQFFPLAQQRAGATLELFFSGPEPVLCQWKQKTRFQTKHWPQTIPGTDLVEKGYNSSQRCSIGLRSGPGAGQSSSFTPNLLIHVFMDLLCALLGSHVGTGRGHP